MYLLIEVWTPKPAWSALSEQERADYAAAALEGGAGLESQGIRTLGWGWLDEQSRGIDHAAFAVWDCGTREGADVLRAAITGAGWYDYFDQVDFGGELIAPDLVMQQHVTKPQG